MEEQKTINKDNKKFSYTIRSDSVVYICGKRQVGKSFCMEKLCQGFQDYIIYDGATHQHGNKGVVVRDLTALRVEWEKGNHKIVFQPFKDNVDLFDDVCAFVWEKGNMAFLIEELGNYCDSFSAPETFDMLVRVGRNKGIGIVAINQRPQRIWNNFVSVIDHWFIFRIELPKDVKFLEEYIGYQRAEALKNLQKRFFFYKNEDGITLCEPL